MNAYCVFNILWKSLEIITISFNLGTLNCQDLAFSRGEYHSNELCDAFFRFTLTFDSILFSFPVASVKLGSLRNHEDNGNKDVTNLHI